MTKNVEKEMYAFLVGLIFEAAEHGGKIIPFKIQKQLLDSQFPNAEEDVRQDIVRIIRKEFTG